MTPVSPTTPTTATSAPTTPPPPTVTAHFTGVSAPGGAGVVEVVFTGFGAGTSIVWESSTVEGGAPRAENRRFESDGMLTYVRPGALPTNANYELAFSVGGAHYVVPLRGTAVPPSQPAAAIPVITAAPVAIPTPCGGAISVTMSPNVVSRGQPGPRLVVQGLCPGERLDTSALVRLPNGHDMGAGPVSFAPPDSPQAFPGIQGVVPTTWATGSYLYQIEISGRWYQAPFTVLP